MLPPEFESIAHELVALFRAFVRQDDEGAALPNLLSAEQQVAAFVRETGRTMLQVFVNVRLQQAKTSRPRCGCGRLPELHKGSDWTRETPLGPVEVHDVYVYCRDCHTGDRPLHAWLVTDREVWSLEVQQAAVDLATDESCGKAVAKLQRHHPGVEMGRTTALRQLHEHGKQAREFIEAKLGKALADAAQEGRRPEGTAELEVEFDGGMIPVATLEPLVVEEGEERTELTPIRGLPRRRKDCRWVEVKAGLVQKPSEVTRLYSLRPTDKLDDAFDDLLALACMKGRTEATRVRGLADGARHIRPRMAETSCACELRFILDRPHAKEHLSSAGEALRAMTGEPTQQWAARALARQEAGHADQVVDELRAGHRATQDDILRLEADYFERNRDAVAYADYRERGWSTASSEVESAHRHTVQVRMKLPGAWWHPDNVDNVLALRMLKANGS